MSLTEQPEKDIMTDIPIDVKSSTDSEPLVKHEVYIVKMDEMDEINQNSNKWSGGLCGCFDNMYPSMCCSILTPNIYVALMHQHVNNTHSSFSNIIMAYLFLNMLCYFIYPYSKIWSGIIIYLSNMFMFYISVCVRQAVRKKRNIPGSNCEDIFVTLFCTPCSIAQTGRTLYNHDKICDSIKFNNSDAI